MSAAEIPVVLIAAVAKNGVIGGDNRLLWRLSSDMKRFKALTMGKPLVMGRKTFESIGRPLPGRDIVVVSRDPTFAPQGVRVARDVEAALALAAERAEAMGATEIMVAGGGEIYAQTIGRARRLEITHVDAQPSGDTSFPPIDAGSWRRVSTQTPPRGPADEADFSFVVYERT